MSKGGEVGEVEEMFFTDRTLPRAVTGRTTKVKSWPCDQTLVAEGDRTRRRCVRSAVTYTDASVEARKKRATGVLPIMLDLMHPVMF